MNPSYVPFRYENSMGGCTRREIPEAVFFVFRGMWGEFRSVIGRRMRAHGRKPTVTGTEKDRIYIKPFSA
jgi:hypothetical protein